MSSSPEIECQVSEGSHDKNTVGRINDKICG